MKFYAVFNLILAAVYPLLKLDSVPSDFYKVVIISSLNNKHGDATAAGNVQRNYDLLFSPVVSKLYETVLHNLFEEFLVNDYLQCLPGWLSGLRHSAHRPERSDRGAELQSPVGR